MKALRWKRSKFIRGMSRRSPLEEALFTSQISLWSQQPLEKLPVQCHPAHKLYSAACMMHLPYQQIRQWPARSIVDVSLRRMQHWCGWHQLCHKGGKIMWTLHNDIIVFAHKLPPDNLLCTSTNTVHDTFFMGCGKVFLRNNAIDLLGHIVPLIHEL